ncbi:MAG: DUF1573 domain-containing protein [Bacteroidales bacterium]|nr:DUF1573 domain-containing protein [Bacteroidales bacterium]
MKRIFSVFLVSVFGVVSLLAQPKIQVSEYEHDFGVFREDAGRQTYNFEVTNTGNAPLVIQNVVASCGCTTPTWTKSPIPPNGKGVITAIYDPAGRPGVFNKTLTVYSNANPGQVVLVIKGEVKEREKTIEELYTWPVGQVRFESNHLAFTTIKKTEKKIKVMPVINTSKEPVKIEFDGVPAHLQLKANPETLKPGQKGVIEGTYDATKNNGWGTITDVVRIKLNGELQNNTYLYVSANLVEDFSSLTKEELANAPVFKVASATVDIGDMSPSTNKEVEFKFTNEGKSDLIIRHIRSTCGCTAVNQSSSNIVKPGESGSIKATFNSGSYKGKVTKAIYVYTNDPANSEVILMLNANVKEN